MYKKYNMKFILLLGLLFLCDSSLIGRTDASPPFIADETNHHNNIAVAHPHPEEHREVFTIEKHPPIVCDACKYLANGMNETVLHNPKVIEFVTEDLHQICSILPQSVQPLCSGAINQTAPLLLNHLGNFIATEGCSDLGVCDGKH
jgi:hypothetical protein